MTHIMLHYDMLKDLLNRLLAKDWKDFKLGYYFFLNREWRIYQSFIKQGTDNIIFLQAFEINSSVNLWLVTYLFNTYMHFVLQSWVSSTLWLWWSKSQIRSLQPASWFWMLTMTLLMNLWVQHFPLQLPCGCLA